jgi:magnesium transporter
MEEVFSKALIETIEKAVESQDKETIRSLVGVLHPADITTLLYEFNTAESKYILTVLDDEVTAEVLTLLEPDTRKKFIRDAFSSSEFVKYVPFMDSDDAVDILNDQPVRFREEVIALLKDREMADYIIELLHYDEDCAGGLMAKELIKANYNWSVVQTIEEIRKQAENVEKIYSVYVVDDQDHLMGRVSLKKIILARSNTKIKDIYESDIVFVESFRDKKEVAEIMQKYDLESVPVVNIQGVLLGRITIDDIVDVITEQAELEQNLMSGLSDVSEDDDTIWESAKSRLPWLLIGMAGGLIGARFAGFFEEDIRLIPAMAFFIPLITATGGNVGIQSSTVMVQSMAGKVYTGNLFLNKILKTLLIALFNAVVIASTVFLFNSLFLGHFQLAYIVSAAIFTVVILASFMGTVTPMVMNHFGVNPALASGPFITTANDLIGLAVYFGVARLLL